MKIFLSDIDYENNRIKEILELKYTCIFYELLLTKENNKNYQVSW